MKKPETIDIILVTFNRKNFLEKTVKEIYKNTLYPHRLWVVDNSSTDGTAAWLKGAKLHGYVHDVISLPENNGLASGYSAGLEKVQSEYFITTQDDCLPPQLKPCWLERLIHLMDENENYTALSMRIQRIRHRDVDEHNPIIESSTSLASVFRIQRKSDMLKVGGFGKRPHWESTSFMTRTKPLKGKLGVTTNIYSDHIGFMIDNKGFTEGFTDYHTYSKERITQGKDQPYPEIDEKSKIPLKIVSPRDRGEQAKRDKYYDYWGRDMRKLDKGLTIEQKNIAQYAEKGVGLDLGCGKVKCHSNAIGMDVYPHKAVDIIGDVTDLWMFKDNELDFIVNAHLLEHLPDTPAVIEEWKRVLKPGGVLAIAVPDGEAKPKYIVSNGHKSNIGLNTLRMLLHRMANMKIIRLEHAKGKKENQFVAIAVAIKK